MNNKQYQHKLQRLTEMRDAYKSALIAEGFMDLLVDLVFGRQIAKAADKLSKDPEYNKTLKKLKDIDKNLIQLQKNYETAVANQIDFYFIKYGIDLYSFDEDDRVIEISLIQNRAGKYKNIKPLDTAQQLINRKLLNKKR